MTTKDVLALALEALEHLQPSALTSFHTISVREKAITAIKQAQEQKVKLIPTAEEMGTPTASAITAAAQQAQEPVAWEATTPGYIKYVTDKQYRSYSETAKRWYKPYKCSSCTTPKQAEPAWQPIESAPFYTDVLIFIEGGGVTIGSAAPKFGWTWHETDDAPEDAKAIGWMPLPTPPEAA